MKKLAIILDSGTGKYWEEIEDCYLVPLTIIEKEGKELKEYEDLKTITTEEVYNKLRQGKDVATAQMKLGNAMILAEDLLEKYENVFVLPLSKGLTGAINSWRQIKEEIGNKNLHIFDTDEVGYAITLLAKEVKNQFLKEKKTPEEIQKWITEQWCPNREGMLIVNDLDALVKGGRISSFKGMIAKMLGIKISILFHGNLDFFAKKTSLEKIVDVSMEKLANTTGFLEKGIDIIIFNKNFSDDNFKEYEEYKELCMKWLDKNGIKVDKKQISDVYLPSVITAHTGINSYCMWLKAKSK